MTMKSFTANKLITVSLYFIAFLLSRTVVSSFSPMSTSALRNGVTSNTALGSTIAVIGASGLTSQECIYQALNNGDKVVGLTRNPANVVVPKGSGGAKAGQPLVSDNLTIIGGDVTKKADVDKVFNTGNKVDGVIIALGGKTADVGETMLRDGTANVIAAMKENGCKRLAVVTSIGTGDSENQAPFFLQGFNVDGHEKDFQRQECSRTTRSRNRR